METAVLVYVDSAGTPQLAGRLWARVRKGRESATFEYAPGWLEHTDRFLTAMDTSPSPNSRTRTTRSTRCCGRRSRCGWRLAPAYDLNPVPTAIKPRVLSTAIDLNDGSASLRLAMSVVGYFELDEAGGAPDRRRSRAGSGNMAGRGRTARSYSGRDRANGLGLRT